MGLGCYYTMLINIVFGIRKANRNQMMNKSTGKSSSWNRFKAAELLNDFEQANQSQRAFAETADVPRTTLQHWYTRAKRIQLPPATVAFFESPMVNNFFIASRSPYLSICMNGAIPALVYCPVFYAD